MTEALLDFLVAHANNRGVVLIREERIVEELPTAHEPLASELARLERAGLVDVIAPLPFLVLKLRSWSGNRPKPTDSRDGAYGYSKLSNNRLIESHRPADQTLLREILDTLGETDSTTFEGAIRNFSPDVIRKALDRVRRARSLRKNRTALFRFLLTKLS